ALPERRFLLSVDVPRAGHPDRPLHADLCRQPDLGLDRPRARAVRQQPADPAPDRVRRPGLSAAGRAARSPVTAAWQAAAGGPGRPAPGAGCPRTAPRPGIIV